MAWSASNRYVEDVNRPVLASDPGGTAAVQTQTQQLSGLLAPKQPSPTIVPKTPPLLTPAPAIPTTSPLSSTVVDNGMGPAVKPVASNTSTVVDNGMGPAIKPTATPAATTPAVPATTPATPATTPTTTTPASVTTPTTTPAVPATTIPVVPPAVVPAPAAGSPNPATPFVMPNAPTMEDDSVSSRLTGLLDSNNPYMQAAREAGIRQANSRGLLNSSIAGGNSEASAIAAAAPIASQEAAQAAQRNQTNLEGYINLRNTTTVQQLSDDAAWQRASAQIAGNLQLQGMTDTSAMQRLLAQGDIEKAVQLMQNDNALTQTQINANVAMIGNYMNAFSALAQNPDVPAAARDAYMQEYLRVTQQGQGLVNALSGVTVTWPGGTPAGTVTTPTTPVHGGNFYSGPSKQDIMAMQHDGTKGNYAAAVKAWNAAFPDDPIK